MRLNHPARNAGKALVVIVGAGFAGLTAAKRLAGHTGIHVVVIDQRNHHLFQPLLYQVATAGLNPADIAVPIRSQFRHVDNVEVHLGRVEGVDLANCVIHGSNRELVYDYLILACGAGHSYFGHEEWEPYAPGLKSLEQATEIRRRIFAAFELAENELDPARQEALLTFVVVGGGPTGVELAGAIADISRTALRGDFRRIHPESARVILIEAGPRILASFPEALSRHAVRDLAQLGVEVRAGTRVDHIDAKGVVMNGQRLPSHTVLWAAGVKAASFNFNPPVETDRAGRVRVGSDCSIPGHANVFVAGDMASFETETGATLPGVAPVAMQSGQHAAESILRDLEHQQRTGFFYRDNGQVATIGRSRAIVKTTRLTLTGRIAWLAWLFVHVWNLVGFRNRAAVVFQWAWNYLFSKRESRLITGGLIVSEES